MEVDALIKQLKDPDPVVRSGAAEALGKIGDGSAVLALIEALKKGDEEARANAASTLRKIERKNPGSVKLDDVQRSLKEFVGQSKDKRSATNEAGMHYHRISETVGKGREKIDMPGELLPDKPKPPRRTFRRRVLRV